MSASADQVCCIFYSSLPPISKAYGTMCLAATTAYQLGKLSPACISLLYPEFWQFQVWKLANLFFLGKFSINFGIRLLLIARYVVQLEKAMWIADFLWMMIFGSLSLLLCVLSTIPPYRSPYLGTSLVYVLLYVRGRKFGERICIFGVNLKAFYLPWVMLGVDVVFGSPLMPDLLGIIVGHLYYFLIDMRPYPSGRYIMRTPSWVHEIVAWWRFG
ncbi:hypothetical protein MKX03_006750 [Papaver bracteatum]|nr:hypothetical protein MKX03_006750 [Papaver bracteatum]